MNKIEVMEQMRKYIKFEKENIYNNIVNNSKVLCFESIIIFRKGNYIFKFDFVQGFKTLNKEELKQLSFNIAKESLYYNKEVIFNSFKGYSYLHYLMNKFNIKNCY